MKSINGLIILLLLLPFHFAFTPVQDGQQNKTQNIPLQECEPKWGADSAKAVENYSLYREYFKQKSYKDALPFWRKLLDMAPGASKRIYIDGLKLMEYQMEQNPDQKSEYVDTLLYLFDQRIQCFGQRGYVLGRKAIRMYQYRSDETEKALRTFEEAVKLTGDETGYYVLPSYFATAVRAYKNETIDKTEILKIYEKVTSIITYNLNNETKYADQYKAVGQKIDNYLNKTGIIESCADAKSVYEERYKENPDDEAMWKNMYELMKNAGCFGDSLFTEVAGKLYKSDPQPRIAYDLARSYKDMENYSEAAWYYKAAADSAKDKEQRADYYYKLAQLYYHKIKNFPKSRQYAQKAIDLRPNWGDPYILIGDLYAASGELCGPGTGFKSQVVIWPALDMYHKAKSVDPNAEQTANKKIATYSQYIPAKSEGFMRDLREGDSYQVGCWINRSTTVRLKEGE